jgi:hypothetical protein
MTAPTRPSHIFVVGCNRTGTSLVRQILNANSGACLAPETHFLRRLAIAGSGRALERLGPLSDDRTIVKLVDLLYAGDPRRRISYWQFLRKNIDRDDFTAALLASDRTERGIFSTFMTVYAQANYADTSGLILGEKTPTHVYSVPVLLEWYPDARIVHTIRDLRAVVVSKNRKLAKPDTRDGLDKLVGLPRALIGPVALPTELAHTTKGWLDAARLDRVYRSAYPGRYVMIRFEDLVREPETEIERLCGSLGIPFEPAMTGEIHVAASGFRRSHRGPEGFDVGAIDRWRESLHPVVDRLLTFVAGQELRRLGYMA